VRVLHLTDDLQGMSGVGSYLLQLREHLRPRGIECELSSQGDGGPLAGVLSRWFSVRHWKTLANRIRSEKPDILHAHNLWMRLSPAPLLAARRAGIPVVMTVHDYHLVCPRKWMITTADLPCETGFGPRCLVSNCRGEPEGWVSLPYNDLRWVKVGGHRRMLRAWVDLFISPSDHLASWLGRSLGARNVVTLPNFTKAPDRPQGPLPGPPPSILFAGRLSREKGVHVLLQAMPLILEKHPRARLTVAGDGSQRTYLEQLARTLGLESRVHFLGRCSAERLNDLFADTNVVVLPTLWMENCPLAVLEAMAQGRPVVATRIGGLPELIEDGVSGALFDRGDAADLAAKILDLFSVPGRAEAAGERARLLHRSRFAPEIHASRLQGIYQSLLTHRDQQ
jgi:glycosyltransferase involved in cell wall biosynthesis